VFGNADARFRSKDTVLGIWSSVSRFL
jgi:hypothetical protein